VPSKRRGHSDAKLYLRRQVYDKALIVWKSFELLQDEKARRLQTKDARREASVKKREKERQSSTLGGNAQIAQDIKRQRALLRGKDWTKEEESAAGNGSSSIVQGAPKVKLAIDRHVHSFEYVSDDNGNRVQRCSGCSMQNAIEEL